MDYYKIGIAVGIAIIVTLVMMYLNKYEGYSNVVSISSLPEKAEALVQQATKIASTVSPAIGQDIIAKAQDAKTRAHLVIAKATQDSPPRNTQGIVLTPVLKAPSHKKVPTAGKLTGHEPKPFGLDHYRDEPLVL